MPLKQSVRQFRRKLKNHSLGVKENPKGSMIDGKTPVKIPSKDIFNHFYGGLYNYDFLVKHFGKFDKSFPKNPKIKPEDDKRIVRELQSKSGSGTYLLGGKLLGRAIIRGVSKKRKLADIFEGIVFTGFTKKNVRAWLKAYQHNWKSEGFDYNPIEPILKNKKGEFRIYKNKDGSYRVSTGLINGISLLTYAAKNYKDKIKIDAMKYKLEEILTKKLKIAHGHLHDANFVVAEQIVNGKLIPRIFIIDFDQAQIK